MNPTQLQSFYEELVRRLRARGVVCAITSGLACVHYGIAETTKDCDLLCHPAAFAQLLELLGETCIADVECRYRGHLSPPLDARWHQGGWTSHFEWGSGAAAVTLDVFGHAVRESVPWPQELLGLYAGPQTVAEMKRTHRDKDWAVLTALGLRMLEAEDERGWLHIFNPQALVQLLSEQRCPAALAALRPALQLGLAGDPRLAGALNAERRFWEELDRRRIQILEHHLRPYVAALRQQRSSTQRPLSEDHRLRIACAELHLPQAPLRDYGIDKYIGECRTALVNSGVLPEHALTWLPDVRIYFEWLKS